MFTTISNLAVTTHVSVNNVGEDLFLKGIFITEQRIQLAWQDDALLVRVKRQKF